LKAKSKPTELEKTTYDIYQKCVHGAATVNQCCFDNAACVLSTCSTLRLHWMIGSARRICHSPHTPNASKQAV